MVATAVVTDIDQANREVTLRGQDGNEFTVTVSDAVRRLDEVRVGDTVRVDYYSSVAAELRPPTAEEAANPFMVTDITGRAPSDLPPAAGTVRQYRVVTVVQAVNLANQTVTVRGPRGHTLTATAANPANLAKIHVGDNVVITYTEGVAISLEKVN
jgi:hypothetical protein